MKNGLRERVAEIIGRYVIHTAVSRFTPFSLCNLSSHRERESSIITKTDAPTSGTPRYIRIPEGVFHALFYYIAPPP